MQRLTVYRHFPDERTLFEACSGHWAAEHPLPDPSAWAAVEDPAKRLELALHELYAHFRATETMTANVRRDLPAMPVIQEIAASRAGYWKAVRTVLDHGWTVRGTPAATPARRNRSCRRVRDLAIARSPARVG